MAQTDLSAFSDSLSQLVAVAAQRVVSIAGPDGGRTSGFVWRNGLIVAAHESLGGEDAFALTLPDGSDARGEVAGRDPTTDVALIKATTAAAEPWAEAPIPPVGALVVVVGRGETSPLATMGMVGESGPAWRSIRGGRIDARLTLALRLPSRCEGGAVIDTAGRLVGMAATGAGGRAIVIPAATVTRAATTLGERGYVPRGYIGLSLHPLEGGKGVIVVGIADGSSAASAGVAIGDIVTTWNGETVSGLRSLLDQLAGASVGQPATLGVQRGGNAIDLSLVVGERPRT